MGGEQSRGMAGGGPSRHSSEFAGGSAGAGGAGPDKSAGEMFPLEEKFADGRYRIASDQSREHWQEIDRLASKEMHSNPGVRQVVREQEGLEMGIAQRRKLAGGGPMDMVTLEPIQRGFDAGFVGGTLLAAGLAWNPKNRTGIMVAIHWSIGFGLGLVGFPMFTLFSGYYSTRRQIERQEEVNKERRASWLKQTFGNDD